MNSKIEDFKNCMGLFTTGITVITGSKDQINYGITINSFSSISLNPLSILFCLYRETKISNQLLKNDFFNVNILSESQKNISNMFAKPSEINWQNVNYYKSNHTNAPVIEGSLAFLECKKKKIFPSGTHSIITADVVSLKILKAKKPLVYFDREYKKIGSDI